MLTELRTMAEAIEDQYLMTVAEEREKHDAGKRYSFEEVLAEDGFTYADVDAMEDVEIE